LLYLSSAPNTCGARLVFGLEQQPRNPYMFSYTGTEKIMQLSLSTTLLTGYHKLSCLQVCMTETIYPLWKKEVLNRNLSLLPDYSAVKSSAMCLV